MHGIVSVVVGFYALCKHHVYGEESQRCDRGGGDCSGRGLRGTRVGGLDLGRELFGEELVGAENVF